MLIELSLNVHSEFLMHMISNKRYAVCLNILVCLLVDKDIEQTLISNVKAPVSAEFHLTFLAVPLASGQVHSSTSGVPH